MSLCPLQPIHYIPWVTCGSTRGFEPCENHHHLKQRDLYHLTFMESTCEPVANGAGPKTFLPCIYPPVTPRMLARQLLGWPDDLTTVIYHSYPKGGGRTQNLYLPLHLYHTSTTLPPHQPTNSSASGNVLLTVKNLPAKRRPRWGGSIDQQWLLWGAVGLGTAPRHGTFWESMIFLPAKSRFFKGEIYVFVSVFPWRVPFVIRCNFFFCFGAFCVGDLIFCFFFCFDLKKAREKSGWVFFKFRVEKIGWGNFVKVNWLASGCLGWFKDEMIPFSRLKFLCCRSRWLFWSWISRIPFQDALRMVKAGFTLYKFKWWLGVFLGW